MNMTTVDELIQKGLAASARNLTEEAMGLFQLAAARAPHAGLPHFLLGAELASAGRMDEAEAAYSNAVLLAPDLHMARYQLGLVQFTSGRAALALVTWEPLFGLPAAHALQQAVHGFAALAQDDFGLAVEHFRTSMALNQDNAPLNRDLQLVIRTIEEHVAAPQQSEGLQETSETDAQRSGELHVLLNNYQRSGPLH